MSTLQTPWSLRGERPVWIGCCGAVYSPMSDSDGSSESDGEVLLSLFEQPEPSYSKIKVLRHDREGRPFPYTRSKTRWRKRPNDEIKYLRTQLVELEELKAALSQPNTNEARNDNQMGASNGIHSEMLDAAMAENRKLRAMVAARFNVAKALQNSIDDHVRQRAQKVYWPGGVSGPDEFAFALLDEEKAHQYAAMNKLSV